jgi:hypothetical protein
MFGEAFDHPGPLFQSQARPVLVVKKTSENVKIDGRIPPKRCRKGSAHHYFYLDFTKLDLFLGGTFSGKMMGK